MVIQNLSIMRRIFNKKTFLFTFWIFLLTGSLIAQTDSVYTKAYLERSTKFAWLTYGGDLLNLSGGTTRFLQNNTVQSTSFSSTTLPRLTIGGIHFWGHADFYVTFPLSFLAFQNEPDGFSDFSYLQGIETGARIYPWKLQAKRISPFVGISFRSMSFSQETEEDQFPYDAPIYERMIAPLQFGLTYTSNKFHITASSYYQFRDNFDYFISPTQSANISVDPLSFNISILRYVDSDRHYRQDKTVRNLNAQHRVLEKENRLSAWYFGIGPSAGLQLSKSSFLRENYPALYNDFSGGFMPDLTFGRYFHKPDLNVGVSYRTLGDRMEGYNAEVNIRRHSFMLEVYSYLFNWLGFAPFLGATGSVESLRTDVNGIEFRDTKPALGVIFGWDIRVTNTGTSLLRTNLRWIPSLHQDISGEKMRFNHLEFNFIQWVHFIGRKKAYLKYRKK